MERGEEVGEGGDVAGDVVRGEEVGGRRWEGGRKLVGGEEAR